MMKRMNFTMPEDLIARIDKHNEMTGIPKSTMVQIAVRQYLDTQKMMDSLPDMMMQVKKLMEEKNND